MEPTRARMSHGENFFLSVQAPRMSQILVLRRNRTQCSWALQDASGLAALLFVLRSWLQEGGAGAAVPDFIADPTVRLTRHTLMHTKPL